MHLSSSLCLFALGLSVMTPVLAGPDNPASAHEKGASVPGGGDDSHVIVPQTRTYFMEGVKTEAQVKDITAAVLAVKTVTKVEGFTVPSGFANITFDHHGVSHHEIAQAIINTGAFNPTFRFAIPQYAEHSEKIDAIFAKVKEAVTVETTDSKAGEFVLHFLTATNPKFNFGSIAHPVVDKEPKGLGLKITSVLRK